MRIFSFPREIYYGEGALEKLADILLLRRVKKIMILTDKNIKKLGYVDKIMQVIKDLNIEVHTFDEIEPEPSFKTAEKIGSEALKFKPEIIIALGGGSVIDAAKAGWAKLERPDINIKEITPFEYLGLGSKARLIAIPTTSGTGSDATFALVLSEYEEGVKRKFPLASYEIVPWISILDPELIYQLPKDLTSSTGLDALTHALEAYVSNQSNDLTDALAEKSVEIILECLPKAYEENDIECRRRLHLAATMAGMAFSNSGTGLAHALGHVIGSGYNIHHGVSVALFLPYVMLYNSRNEKTFLKYVKLANKIGIIYEDNYKTFRKLLSLILQLYVKVDQPLSLNELKIENYLNELDRLIDLVYADPDLPFNPIMPSPEDIRTLLIEAYTGDPLKQFLK